jgi:pyruvate,water dikinase
VAGPEEFDRVQPGDVLVCRTTTPPWTMLFPLVGAIVTDSGGILSHCATVAREYGIPAVVGTRQATRLLEDGEKVIVDGGAGTVRRQKVESGVAP